MRINVLQHTPNEGPGSIASWAFSRGHEFFVYHPYFFDGVLPKASETDLLIILGGPMSPNDELPWISKERELIKKLSKEGVTILLTTHYMPEAEELCDRIAIIKKGKLLAIDDVVGLQNLVSNERKEEIKAKKEREQEEKNKKNLEITLEDIYIELLGDA